MCERSGAARPVAGQHRWNIGAVAVLAGLGLRGSAGRMGPAARLARARRAAANRAVP
jgi:hypothetical protein